MTTSTAAITADAWIRVGWLAYRALLLLDATDRGCSSGGGQIQRRGVKSFQAKWNRVTAVIAGMDAAGMTLRKTEWSGAVDHHSPVAREDGHEITIVQQEH